MTKTVATVSPGRLSTIAFVVLILTVLLSTALVGEVVMAGKGGGGKPQEPPADPAIAYLKTTGGPLRVMNVDGTNQVEIYSARDLRGHPTWSPSGDAIAFTIGQYTLDLWRINVSVVNGEPQGTDPYRLTQDIDWKPAWSPQGDEIAFVGLVDRARRLIQTIPATGGTVETIYTSPERTWVHHPTWRSDGSQLAFVEQNLDNNQKSIVVLDLSDGSTRTVYGPASGGMPAFLDWARTKDVLAYVKHTDGIGAIYTLDITEETPTPQLVLTCECRYPSWSPDDSQLAFEKPVYSKGGSVKYVSVSTYDFSTEEVLTLAKGYKPDWSRHVST